MSSAGALSSQQARGDLDELFTKILAEMIALTSEEASTGVQRVLDFTGAFVSSEARAAVAEFRALYFQNAAVRKESESINRQVDDLFDQLQDQLAAGGELDAESNVAEDKLAAERRVGLAGIQRHLESLVSLDNDIKRKLMPIMTSMQFEDAMRQRLEHIMDAWQKVAALLASESPATVSESIESLANTLAANLTSNTERQAFYRLVLHKAAPASEDEPNVCLF